MIANNILVEYFAVKHMAFTYLTSELEIVDSIIYKYEVDWWHVPLHVEVVHTTNNHNLCI